MRLAFLGSDAWSVPSLQAVVAAGHDVSLVATREPKPAGRGNRLTRTPVAEVGEAMGLPIAEVATIREGEGFDRLAGSRPDALVVVAYGEILPPAVLEVPRTIPVNVHFSLLPELRGAAPVQWAILRGLAATGVTTIRMDEGLDTGPVLLQAEEAIDPADDAGSLGARLAALGGTTLVETLARIEAGDLAETPQDHTRATLAPKLSPDDRWIDWSEPAEAIARRVRALAPEPGASTRLDGRLLKVFRARAVEGEAPPGVVAEAGDHGFTVGTGEGLLAPEEVAPEGRRRMAAGDFVRGYRLRAGRPLG